MSHKPHGDHLAWQRPLTDRPTDSHRRLNATGQLVGARYDSAVPRHVRWHRIRIGLVVALVLIFAGVVIDSLLSASWVLDDGLLLLAAVVIALALVLTRRQGRSEAK
jgi:hypothetical protein